MQAFEWRPLFRALGGLLLILTLALGTGARGDTSAEASHGLLQTVPTPTPQTIPTPGAGETPRPPREEPSPSGESGGGLRLGLQALPRDVLPGEELEYTLAITNTSTAAITGIVLTAPLHPALDLLQVSATQGAVEVQGQSLAIHLGTLEPRQTALIVIRSRVGPEASRGLIILHQATAHLHDDQVRSNVAAAGLPPDELPATGRDRRGP